MRIKLILLLSLLSIQVFGQATYFYAGDGSGVTNVTVLGTFPLASGKNIPHWDGGGSVQNAIIVGGNASGQSIANSSAFIVNGVFTGNGAGVTNIQPFLIQTNFNSGQLYTNNYGCAITICANVVNTVAAVAGSSDIALMSVASPTVGGWTNHQAIQSFLTSIAMNYTNVISLYVPTNAPYWFTNLSIGVLNSSTVIGGQIKYP